jgi:hypothetical protein
MSVTFITIPPPPVVLSVTFDFTVAAGGTGAGTLPCTIVRDTRGLSVGMNILGGSITAPSAGAANTIVSAPLDPVLPSSVQPGGNRIMIIDIVRGIAPSAGFPATEPAQLTLSSTSVLTITRLGNQAFGASEVITIPNITCPYR